MRKLLILLALLSLLLPTFAANAASAEDARQTWQNAIAARLSADVAYKQATEKYQKDKTPENDAGVIDAAKAALRSVLNEAEAWLNWKNAEAQANPYASDEIKQNIGADVNKNLAKISGLRQEVDAIDNRIEVATVFIKIAGSYVELLADVARNTGAVWVEWGNKLIATAESLEAKLREAATDNTPALAALDKAKTELTESREHANEAAAAYKLVTLPGTPLIKFAEGNKHLRLARLNLLTAQEYLAEAWRLIAAG